MANFEEHKKVTRAGAETWLKGVRKLTKIELKKQMIGKMKYNTCLVTITLFYVSLISSCLQMDS